MTTKFQVTGKNKLTLLAHICGFIAVAIWGVSFVSTKVLLDHHVGPVTIYIYRFVLAYLLVLCINHKRFRSNNWRDEAIFALCGMSGGSLYFIAENTALQYTLVTNVSLLTSLSPLLTTMLVGLLYKNQKPNSGTVIGSIIAFMGVACVIFNSAFLSGELHIEINPLGDFLSIAAALLWAVYGLLVKNLNANYDVWYITRKIFFYGVITAVPFWLLREQVVNPLDYMSDPAVVTNVIFLGVGASLVGFLMWSVAIKGLGAIKANNYMYFQAVVTLIFSAIILDERITIVGAAGCATILLGLWLGDWLSRRQTMKR